MPGPVFLTLRSTSELQTPGVVLDATWQKLSVDLAFSPGSASDVYVGSNSPSGTCFLVDDLEVHRVD